MMPLDAYGSLLDASIDGAYSSFVAWAVPALVVVGTCVFCVTVFLIGQRIRQEDQEDTAVLDKTLDELDALDETLYTPTPSGRRRLVKPLDPMPPVPPVIVPLAGVLDGGALPASQVVLIQSPSPVSSAEQTGDIPNETMGDADEQPTQVMQVLPVVQPVTPVTPVKSVVYPVIQGPFGVLVLAQLSPIPRDMLN